MLILPAYAKINWYLHILGRRADGWHELETVFQTISLCDELTFSAQADERISLSVNEGDVPADETNLIVRAAHTLRCAFGSRRGAHIHLEKRIPVGGGLGGGSSDAAIALLGLAKLWQLDVKLDDLAVIGARLGADVPFFLTGGTALGTGTGVAIHPLEDIGVQHLLVITPPEKVLSAEAYKNLRAPALTKDVTDINLTVSRARSIIGDFRVDALRNDFEAAIFPIKPEIERARNALLAQGASCALMSGSGASVFGVFDNQHAQQKAQAALAGDNAQANWRTYACTTVSRERYRAAYEQVAIAC